jgi:hypothetical protein
VPDLFGKFGVTAFGLRVCHGGKVLTDPGNLFKRRQAYCLTNSSCSLA